MISGSLCLHDVASCARGNRSSCRVQPYSARGRMLSAGWQLTAPLYAAVAMLIVTLKAYHFPSLALCLYQPSLLIISSCNVTTHAPE